MAINSSAQYSAAIRRQLSKEVLPLTQRYLVAYQFAEKKKLEKGAGVTWTATRFNRLPLPDAPLSEGVPPDGQTLNISQVTGVALQWGDRLVMTDVSVLTTMYDLIQQAKIGLARQIAETRERNIFGVLSGGTQVNYVNLRGSRALLVAGDVLDTTTITRTSSDLENLGTPFYNGQTEDTVRRSIEHGARASEKGPMASQHYVSIISPLVENDLRQNNTIATAWSYSDVTRLYINEIGYWGGIHFTKSNMMPRWTGNATAGGAVAAVGGNLTAGGATYYTVITGTDSLGQFGESQIYAVDGGTVMNAPNNAITVTMPATTGLTYSVYIGTTTSPVNLATSPQGPTSGFLTGQATKLAPSQVVTLTGIGLFKIPPACPAAGVTVYKTFVFGAQYFAVLELEGVQWTTLFEADKSDTLNQLRVVGWKYFEGSVILNQQFGCSIESSVSNTGAFG